MSAGRPTKYTKELGEKLCDLIATTSRGLRSICKELEINPTTVLRWLDAEEQFRTQYARARELQADLLADEIILLSKREKRTKITTQGSNGEGSFSQETTQDNHQRTRIMVDAYKWKASKLAPKKYGDKIDLTSAGKEITNQPPSIVINHLNTGVKLANSESDIEDKKP